jgi:phosphatidylserine/phosphatidylglycerophosphate/cardiolipin synthase-like enzyme
VNLRLRRPVACLASIALAACGGDDSATPTTNTSGHETTTTGAPQGGGSQGGAGQGGEGQGGAAKGGSGQGGAPVANAKAILEVHPLDLWAQPFPKGEAKLTITRDGKPAPANGNGTDVVAVPLDDAGTYTITLGAPEHEDLTVTVTYDGSTELEGATLTTDDAAKGAGHSLGHETRQVNGRSMPVHSVWLGLRHKWFSAEGRPARRGNAIELLHDGEDAWGRAHGDLTAAQSSILLSTWWWESDFEISRPDPDTAYFTQDDRWPYTMLGTLEASPATKRILVNQFWGQDSMLTWLNTDSKLKAWADAPGDGFELMGQANPTSGTFWFKATPFSFGDRVRAAFADAKGETFADEAPIESRLPEFQADLTAWPVNVNIDAASYHQKFLVIDDVAYVGGMNVKAVDWDTSEHRVFEYRRMGFKATTDARLAVQTKDKLPETGPRKDYYLRIHGPAVQDVADVFQERWAYLLGQGVDYSENSTPFDVARDVPAQPGGAQIQVCATLPQPFWEHAIAESWINAVSQAEKYIFIEDQYFRAPLLHDAIATRMNQNPDVRLVVVTKPINEWTDPGCPQTYMANQLFEQTFPDRYLLLQYRAWDTHVTWGIDETKAEFQDMDTHAKMLIVDDKFMSVGSANKNNRGMMYEGELSVAVLDAAFVRAERRKILANVLPPGTPASDDAAVWWDDLVSAAAWNDGVYAKWKDEGFDINLNGDPVPTEYVPNGLVYSMHFGPPSDCLIESVGPDVTGKPKNPWSAPY